MVSVESSTASIPGPRPPTQVLIRTIAKNSYHGGASTKCCRSSETRNAPKTQNTANPYLSTADGSHRGDVANVDIPFPPRDGPEANVARAAVKKPACQCIIS